MPPQHSSSLRQHLTSDLIADTRECLSPKEDLGVQVQNALPFE